MIFTHEGRKFVNLSLFAASTRLAHLQCALSLSCRTFSMPSASERARAEANGEFRSIGWVVERAILAAHDEVGRREAAASRDPRPAKVRCRLLAVPVALSGDQRRSAVLRGTQSIAYGDRNQTQSEALRASRTESPSRSLGTDRTGSQSTPIRCRASDEPPRLNLPRAAHARRAVRRGACHS